MYCTSVLFFCVLNCGLLATAEKAAGLYWSVAAGYWGWGWPEVEVAMLKLMSS